LCILQKKKKKKVQISLYKQLEEDKRQEIKQG
jgi:hypothetical protein